MFEIVSAQQNRHPLWMTWIGADPLYQKCAWSGGIVCVSAKTILCGSMKHGNRSLAFKLRDNKRFMSGSDRETAVARSKEIDENPACWADNRLPCNHDRCSWRLFAMPTIRLKDRAARVCQGKSHKIEDPLKMIHLSWSGHAWTWSARNAHFRTRFDQ